MLLSKLLGCTAVYASKSTLIAPCRVAPDRIVRKPSHVRQRVAFSQNVRFPKMFFYILLSDILAVSFEAPRTSDTEIP